MRTDLNQWEIYKILSEKFGETNFRVFYTETDAEWEAQHRQKISELTEPPKKMSVVLYFNP